MRQIIHLNALRAFEASARHQSFSAAAKELNVTPAAVGQLVRTLENWLGTPLFHRSASGPSRLIPTETAERALPDLRAGFDRLVFGIERLREGAPNGVLTVAVSPAFAGKWLLPRLESFHLASPDTDVRLDTNLRPVDFVAQGIDIGVRYGKGSWPGLAAIKLMDEDVFPVCAPRLQGGKGPLALPTDLIGQTLIHDLSMDQDHDFPSWKGWLRANGISDAIATRGLKINNSAAVLQAAIDGQGIALARSVMAHDDLKAGRLIRLFPQLNLVSPFAYFIVFRPECASLPRLVAFKDWLLSQAASCTDA